MYIEFCKPLCVLCELCIYTDVHVLSRSDANQNNLRTSAYEALIDHSAKVS